MTIEISGKWPNWSGFGTIESFIICLVGPFSKRRSNTGGGNTIVELYRQRSPNCSEMFELLVISSFTVPVLMWNNWNSEQANFLHSLYESWDCSNPRGDNGGGNSDVAIPQKLRCCRKWPQAVRRCTTVWCCMGHIRAQHVEVTSYE